MAYIVTVLFLICEVRGVSMFFDVFWFCLLVVVPYEEPEYLPNNYLWGLQGCQMIRMNILEHRSRSSCGHEELNSKLCMRIHAWQPADAVLYETKKTFFAWHWTFFADRMSFMGPDMPRMSLDMAFATSMYPRSGPLALSHVRAAAVGPSELHLHFMVPRPFDSSCFLGNEQASAWW